MDPDNSVPVADSDDLPEPTPIRAGLPKRRTPVRKKARTEGAEPVEEGAVALARRIVDLASDKKASDIVLLEVGALTTVTDYLVICSAQSDRQLGAVADGIIEGLRD